MRALGGNKKTEGQRRKERKNMLVGYAFIFPIVIGLIIFTAVPFFTLCTLRLRIITDYRLLIGWGFRIL